MPTNTIYRTYLSRQPERTSGTVTFVISNQAVPSAPVPKAAIASLRLTLYDRASGAIINSRNNQDVLDLGDVTMHATSGLVTWTVQPADMAIPVENTAVYQERFCRFVAVWGGANPGERAHEIVIPVENLRQYPAV